MERFLLIGCIDEECGQRSASLRKLYPECNVEVIELTGHFVVSNAENISAALVFSAHMAIAAVRKDLPDTPLIVIQDDDLAGLRAVAAGAEDYVLADAGDAIFENAISKLMARSTGKHFKRPSTKDAPYETLLSAINEIVWSKNADDHKLQYVNSACEALLGYTPGELLSNRTLFTGRIHPDDRQIYDAAFLRMMTSGRMEEYEFRFRRKDGMWRYLRSRGGVVNSTRGEKKMLGGITIDITNLVNSETVVREKTEALEDILESIDDCVYSLDKDWNFTYLNTATERIFNVKRADLLGKNIWEMYPLGKTTNMYVKYHQAVAEQKTMSIEGFSPNINKWIYTSAYPSHNGLTIFIKDISRRKELEEKIFTDRQNLLSIMNATADVIWSVDKELNLLVANQAYWDNVTTTTGKTREELGSKITAEAYGEETVRYWKEVYARGFLGSRFKMVETYETAAGFAFLEITMNPIRDLEQNVVGLSCFSRDITQTKEHLTKIELQNQKMREIAWIQSHKVRGPVSTILGLAQIFNIDEPDNAVNQIVINGIRETTQYLDEIIREIVKKANEIE